MATVVLSTVGTIIGGPIGGAIGAIVGQQFDQAVFGSGKSREGPRLKELDVQTSSYGTQIPAIFGAMRVAGTVIWSTDLIERRQKSGGGKNRPSTVDYSYSASFAVAVSSRPVARIGRIWADGNLLRGAAGDFKTETVFHFHHGSGDQLPDPLLVSAEAMGQCSAYRNLAYAVFEDLQLADFGNRIPSLTFEIFERDGSVDLAEIVSACSDGTISGESNTVLTGFSAQGSDCRSALNSLLAAFPVTITPDGDRLVLNDWSESVPVVPLDLIAVSDGTDQIERLKRSREASNRAPAMVSIRHYEPVRDFQAGLQSSRRMGQARSELQIELPAALDADTARLLAEQQLLQKWRGLNGMRAAIARKDDIVRVGALVSPGSGEAPLRITELEHQRGTTRILAREWIGAPLVPISADPGRNLTDPDLAIGETRMVLADLPVFGIQDPGRAVIVVALAGTEAGWKRAALSLVDGDRIVDIGQSRVPAIVGTLLTPLPAHTALLEDRDNRPVVRLLHEGMTLPTGTGSIRYFDAPRLWIGGEIIRYAHAEQIGVRDYRLSGLVRDSEGLSGDNYHPAGTAIFLIEEQSLTVIDSVPTPIGAALAVEALGTGDDAPVHQTVTVTGHAIVPRRPVHGAWELLANGDVLVSWKRRDRLAYEWTDGVDVPNSEGASEFEVVLKHMDEDVASWRVSNSAFFLPADQRVALGFPANSAVEFHVRQQGRFALSPPLAIAATI